MPGNVTQELTRILNQMRDNGQTAVWLSNANRQAFQTALQHAYAPASFQRQPAPQAFPQQPAQPQPTQAFPPQPAPQAFQPQPAQPQTTQAFPQQATAMPAPAPMPVPQAVPQQATAMPASAPSPAAVPVKEPAPVEMSEEWIRKTSQADWEELETRALEVSRLLSGRMDVRLLMGIGAKRARVMFIGEFPTQADGQENRLLAGKAGLMLRKMAEAMGLKWEGGAVEESVYYTTILKYRPTSMPTQAQYAATLPVLRRQVELVEPDALVLLGKTPVLTLCEKDGAFSEFKGQWMTYKGLPVMVIQNPAQILRFENQQELFYQERKAAWEALLKVMEALGLHK